MIQNIVIHIIRYRVKHFRRTCYTLHRTLFNIVQWYNAHCTEHWYWCTLHRTLVQIAQNIDAHCIEHLHTFHRTFEHIPQNIDTLAQNIIYWTLCRTLHFTHTQTTHTLNISWDISLTHNKVSLCCKVYKYISVKRITYFPSLHFNVLMYY